MTYADRRTIDVVINSSGNELPMPRLIKRDGKYFPIQEVKRVHFDSGRQRVPVEKYLVNINGYDKDLIKEGSRWYMLNESEDEMIFADPSASPSGAIAI